MVRYHVESLVAYQMKRESRLTMNTSGVPEAGESGRKDANHPSAAHADNLPFLNDDDSQPDQIEEQHDKSVCSACCDSLSVMSVKSATSNTMVSSRPPTDQSVTDAFISSHSSGDNTSTLEYISLPTPEADEEIPLEVSAVLVELPDLIPPPPPYTLVRGRRMRFLTQRMHLPADGHRYLTEHYRQQQDHSQQTSGSEDGKGCCSTILLPESLNVRWFIIIICFIALCCVVVGIVLGALKGANEFTQDDSLTIALLLIGVGIILMAVSGAAWKLTAKQGSATSLRTMLGFGSLRATSPPLRSFRRASTGAFSAYLLRNSFGRGCSGHYHEFQFRPPPPSYHASISEQNYDRSVHERNTGVSHNRTPPPIYRERARGDPAGANPLPLLNQLNIISLNEYQMQQQQQRSAPPSYRFRPAVTPVEAAGEQRVSTGQINATFSEESCHSAEGCPRTVNRHQPGVDGHAGQSTSARRAPADPLSTRKNSHNCNMELLAQL